MLGPLIAAGIAGGMTFFEIDQVFAVPKKSPGRWGIRMAVAAFVVVNALLAILLYQLLEEAGFLASVTPVPRGALIGAGYLGLVRLKFATLKDEPFGFEYFYELAKQFAYRRINRRVIDARHAAAKRLAEKKSLADLLSEANVKTNFDSLSTLDEKAEVKAWILRVVEDSETEEAEKKLILADFILSGSRMSHE